METSWWGSTGPPSEIGRSRPAAPGKRQKVWMETPTDPVSGGAADSDEEGEIRYRRPSPAVPLVRGLNATAILYYLNDAKLSTRPVLNGERSETERTVN